MLRVVNLVVIGVCLSGCASYSWHHPSKGQSELHKDEHACFERAAQTFPYELRTQTDVGYTPPLKTSCNTRDKQANCEKLQDIYLYMPPPTTVVDANQDNRDRLFDLCMKARGWSLSKDK